LSQIDLRTEARPYLIHLSELVQEVIHLVVLDGDKALYIDKVDLHPKSSGLQMISRLGSRIDLYCCSVGKVLLAHMEAHEAESIISKTELTKATVNTITNPDRLIRHLAAIRKNGYAIDDEENEQGIRCVAAPITNGSGKVEAAISISGPTTRITMERIESDLKARVCQTANQISAKLGYRQFGEIETQQ
jgi:DNA-binding IclR family transcriptional regulator